MSRLLNFTAGAIVIGAACALYALKYDTRKIETLVQQQERMAEALEADIAALKAERAYLGRPERIEALARAQGLAPARESQYLRIGEVPDDEIGRLIDRSSVPTR